MGRLVGRQILVIVVGGDGYGFMLMLAKTSRYRRRCRRLWGVSLLPASQSVVQSLADWQANTKQGKQPPKLVCLSVSQLASQSAQQPGDLNRVSTILYEFFCGVYGVCVVHFLVVYLCNGCNSSRSSVRRAWPKVSPSWRCVFFLIFASLVVMLFSIYFWTFNLILNIFPLP